MKLADVVKPIGLFVLAIPFVAMLAMIGINYTNVTAYKEYRFEIIGYDPRDLLRGHYLTFRYKWPDDAIDMYQDNSYSSTDQMCACLSGDAEMPDVRFDACVSKDERQKECKTGIKISYGDKQPAQELRQKYIPEGYATRLEIMLRSGDHKFEIGIVPRPGHEAQVSKLYIDGVHLDEYLNTDHTVSVKNE